ncbi:hypothetical protein [Actinacidiphila acidipaludis]|uniref:Uncharacterized protein n=1 Tax=Actinacidiphila acidipaludis TaxID=2873382 RepID=A0ABS7Q0A9_9ACTN|nr:hypothetical protein [Streptomyces acidipaludis]MBY8876331.1 hypothetical protein [Streptomyces acidipaludis]
MSCAEVKAAIDRLDAKLYVKPRDLTLLKEGDALALDHPACFNADLVEGARNLKKDLDKGIVPAPPVTP